MYWFRPTLLPRAPARPPALRCVVPFAGWGVSPLPLRAAVMAWTAFAGDIEGVGGGESECVLANWVGMAAMLCCSPSTLLRSDRAFLLLAASALCAAASCFCFSRISFSRLFRAAVPRSVVPFLPAASFSAGSGEPLFFEEESELVEPVRWRLLAGLRLQVISTLSLQLADMLTLRCRLGFAFQVCLEPCFLQWLFSTSHPRRMRLGCSLWPVSSYSAKPCVSALSFELGRPLRGELIARSLRERVGSVMIWF